MANVATFSDITQGWGKGLQVECTVDVCTILPLLLLKHYGVQVNVQTSSVQSELSVVKDTVTVTTYMHTKCFKRLEYEHAFAYD